MSAAVTNRHPGEPGGRRPIQVFARDVRLPEGAPLVRLEPGQAATLRPEARTGHLICPIDGCTDPRLTTRAGSRRDHFAHLRAEGGGHAPETVAHHTAKHLLAAWLRRVHPDATVHPDTQDVDDGQRPDVLVDLPTGRQVAYEVQFAGLTGEEWERRHQRYAAQGVRDVWLFGGQRYNRRPRWVGAEGTTFASRRVLVPVFPHVLAAEHPLLLIDPETEHVALGVGLAVEQYLAWRARDADVVGDDFDAAWLRLQVARSAHGVIDLPGLRDQLSRAADRHHAEVDHRAQVREGREQRRAEYAAAVARHANLVAAWGQRRRQLEVEHGPFPAVIDQHPDEREVRLPLAPSHWRLRVLEALEQHADVAVDPTELWRVALAGDDRPRDLAHTVMQRFLAELKRSGWVWFAGKRGPRADEAVLVLATRDSPPDPASAAALARAEISGGFRRPLMLVDPHTQEVVWQMPTHEDPAARFSRTYASAQIRSGRAGRVLVKDHGLPGAWAPLGGFRY